MEMAMHKANASHIAIATLGAVLLGGSGWADGMWERVVADGFGSSDNLFSGSMTEFGEGLYVGTGSPFPWVRCEVWRFPSGLVFSDDFGTGDTSRWSAAVP